MSGTKEAEAAKLLQRLEEFFDADGDHQKVMDRLKAIESVTGPLKDLDVKATLEEFDKLKSAQAQLVKNIRSQRGPGYVSGIEDEDFSIIRACMGRRFGFEREGAMKEKEIMDQSAEALRKRLPEAKAQSVSDDALGGSFVPDQVIPDVVAAIYTRSAFVALDGNGETAISILDGMFGGNVRVPAFEGGTIAYWTGEEDEYVESAAKTGDRTMQPHKLGVLVKITEDMRAMQGFGFEGLLRTDMTRAAAKKLDWTAAYGVGSSDMPRGIVYTNGIKVWSAQAGAFVVLGDTALSTLNSGDWQGATFGFDGLMDAQLAFEEDDIDLDGTYRTISSPRFFNELKKSKIDHFMSQSENQAYLLGAPMLTDQQLAGTIGPFGKTTQIGSAKLPGASVGAPTTDTSPTGDLHTDVFKGNFGEVVMGRWSGIEIVDDGGMGTGFTSDTINQKLRLRVDFMIRQPRAIMVVPDALVR